METVYVMEVESGNKECELYYAPDGTLVRVIEDYDGSKDTVGIYPGNNPSAVGEFLDSNYPERRLWRQSTIR